MTPRIEPLTVEEATGQAKQLLEGVNAKMGRVPNLLGTLAHAPAALKGYLDLSANIASSSLDAKTREQIALYVGQVNQCNYCQAAHTAIGKSVGLSEEETIAARQGTGIDTRSQAIFDFVGQILETKGFVSDEDVKAAREAGLSDQELLEIVATVLVNFYTNYFNHIFETEVDFPPAKPL